VLKYIISSCIQSQPHVVSDHWKWV